MRLNANYFQFWAKLLYVLRLRFACVYVGVFDQHLYLYTTCDLISKGIRSLNGKKSGNLHVGRKTKRIEICGKALESNL